MARWKVRVEFLLSVIELLFLPLTVEALQDKMSQNSLPSGGGRSLGAKISGGRGHPLANILIPLERQLIRYKFVADSFYIMKLCSWILVLYCGNYITDDKFRYLVPIFRKLVRGGVEPCLMACWKARVRLPIRHIWTFSLPSSLYRWHATRQNMSNLAAFRRGWALRATISGRKGRPSWIFFAFYNTRHILLSDSVQSFWHNTGVWQTEGQVYRRTDGQTDGIAVASTAIITIP